MRFGAQRSGRAGSRFGWALGAGWLFWSASLWAEGPPRSALELSYDAALSCPDRGGFSELVERRLLSSEAGAASGSHAQVRLSNEDAGFVGQLELTRPDGSRYQRRVSDASCQEVANALSFVLALALGAKDPSLTPPPTGGPPHAEAAPMSARVASPGLNLAAPRALRFAGGTGFGVRTGLGPVWTTLEGAFLEVRHAGAFSWSMRGSLEHTQTVTRIDRNGTTDFSWTAGSVSGCPYRVELGRRWALATCLGLHLGAIRAVGRPAPLGSARGRARSELWADGFFELRLELRLLPALALEAQGALVAAFTPYQFTFDQPVTPVYRVPALATAGSFALVALIP